MTLWERIERWRTFADTDYTKGQKLSDSKKQGQYELMMAGQSIAYATTAKELEADLRELRAVVERVPHGAATNSTQVPHNRNRGLLIHDDRCPRCALEARIGGAK